MKLSLKRADELMERLLQIPEPRNAKGMRHQKISVTATAVCAIMSNAGSFAAIAEWAAGCSRNMPWLSVCWTSPVHPQRIHIS